MSGKSDFGEILSCWESQAPSEDEAVLKEKGDLDGPAQPRPTIGALRRLPPQDTLDLHGLTVSAAVARTALFIRASRAAALDKVAIITGKGLHSQGGSVVRSAVLAYLQNNTMVREVQKPSERWGGGGAVWVVLKRG